MMGASEVLGILADDTRRRLLLILCENESVRVPDALLERGGATQRARTNGDDETLHRSSRQLESRLHHVHLPKLVTSDVVEWNREDGTVRRGPRFGEIEPVLCVLAENVTRVPQDLF